MTPEEGVRAYVDLQGGDPAKGVMLSIHWRTFNWRTFNLAPHLWEEPAEGSVTAARAAGAIVTVPRPGQPFEPARGLPLELWWRAVAARPSTDVPARAGEAVGGEGEGKSLAPDGPVAPAGPDGPAGTNGGADPAVPLQQA